MKSQIEQQQAEADKVFHILDEVGLSALLAGGAPRNWYHNRLANDLDFYIMNDHLTIPEDFPQMELVEKFEKTLPESLKFLGEYNGYTSKIIYCENPYQYYTIVEWVTIEGLIIQLMIDKEMEFKYMTDFSRFALLMDRFNVNISKITWTRSEGFRKSSSFEEAVETKTLKFVTPPDDYSKKIIGQFPDYQVEFFDKYEPWS